MVEEIGTIALGADRLAIIDRDKSGIGAQAPGDLLLKRGTGGRIGAFDAHQDQARGESVTYLLQEQLLRWRWAARQKRR